MRLTQPIRYTLALLAIMHCLQGAIAYSDPALDKADQFLKAGRADAATAIYQEYLRSRPTALHPQLAMANIAIRRFEYPKARHILERALAQHPDSAITAASLGRLFQQWTNGPAGQTADNSWNYLALAQEHFRQAVALGPDEPLVLTYVGEWQLQQNDMIAAERDLQKAVQIKPTLVPAYQGLTRFYMKAKELKRAKETILHALELDPQDQSSYFLTAQLLDIANRPAEAVKYAEKSEQLDFGRLPERDYFLARQYEKLGEAAKAVQYYENLTVYTPREAQIWLKLGDLYDSLNQPEKSLKAYRQALALKPDILDTLYVQARDNTRAEKIDLALNQWRRLLAIQPDQPETVQEALGAIAGLHYLHRFLHPEQAHPAIQRDLPLFETRLLSNGDNLMLSLDYAKITIALNGQLTEPIRQELQRLASMKDPFIAGEAAFLLEDYTRTTEALENVDGLEADEYARLGDRLLMVQELVFSKVFYQRAQQLQATPGTEAALRRIQAKQSLAMQRVNEGNLAFSSKDYPAAIEKYREAARIYRQWDNVYLRLGDTYEKQRKWKEAHQAYETAIRLSPGLMSSPGFAKHYQKLAKKAD